MSVADLIEKNLNVEKREKFQTRKQTNDSKLPPAKSLAHERKKQLDFPNPDNERPNYHLLKVQYEARLKEIAIQKELGRLIPREKVSPIWNRIYKSLSYFSEFGQRYAGEWGAALGVSDPERIQDLENMIDEATEKFAADFASTVASEI
jgi:hypothetical protein